MDRLSIIKKNLTESIELKTSILNDTQTLSTIDKIVELVVASYQHNGKILFCGNGGSAADAQHLAAEFSGRYYYDRPPLNAEALHVNTSYLTAVANDYSFSDVYSRMINAIGNKGDILFGLSTSGNSENVVNALIAAQKKGCITVGFCGQNGGKMEAFCDYIIKINANNTPRIQECHMLIGHSICELVEAEIFPQ